MPHLPRILAVVIIATLALSGCTPADQRSPAEKLQALVDEQIGSLPGVTLATSEPATGVNVTVLDAVTSDQLVTIATATRALVDNTVGDSDWTSTIAMEIVDTVADDDLGGQTRLSIEVYPTVITDPGADAADAMSILGLGAESVSLLAGTPFVTVPTAAALEPMLDALEPMALWSKGGTLWAEYGRVRLRDVPDRLTPIGLRTVISSALAYPAAQFWIEAPLSGPQWPRLYINELSTEEAAALATSLQDPTLPPMTTIDGYVLEFNIRVIGADGATDTWGAVGVAPVP